MEAPRAGRRRRLTAFTALGFLVGSVLFAVGVPLSLDTALSPVVGAATFFVGSLFFTCAGFLQLVTSSEELPSAAPREHAAAWFAALVRARTVDWTASAIQFAGTLWFNVTTLRGLLDASGAGDASAAAVWRPDAFGSVCFLVASALALVATTRRRHLADPDSRTWWSAWLNMLGSIAFGISALGAYVNPDSGQLQNASAAAAGTFIGAVGFLAGALVMRPRGAPRLRAEARPD